MIVKDAKVTKLIGCERLSSGEVYHTLTLLIEAKRINPEDFKDLKDGDIKIEVP